MYAATTVGKKPTYVLGRAEVRAVERVLPNFVRITLVDRISMTSAPRGRGSRRSDQDRLPPGILPPLNRDSESWRDAFFALPEAERGSMRTYSIRDLSVTDADTLVTVDFVLHLAPGLTGSASLWASSAAVGDEVFVVGPHRGVPAEEHGGIEYRPGAAGFVVLAGVRPLRPR